MATNIIAGRIVVKESGVGIPDLLVVLYDVDADAERHADGGKRDDGERQDGLLASQMSEMARDRHRDRIGSRVTDGQGAFQFSFGDEEFRIRGVRETRPDLYFVVTGPEEPGVAPTVLFESAETRRNAGRSEEVLIKLSASSLRGAGISIPADPAARD